MSVPPLKSIPKFNPLKMRNNNEITTKETDNKLNLFISDDYFPIVKTINRKIKINFSSNINRSLEYYSGMVFNITVNKKGKQFSLISGGRYYGLLKNLGSKKNTTAVGAAIDMSLL